jgi:hypothetical protein
MIIKAEVLLFGIMVDKIDVGTQTTLSRVQQSTAHALSTPNKAVKNQLG